MNQQTVSREHELPDLVGRRIARRLTQGNDDLPYDISERLRAARMQALARRKMPEVTVATRLAASGGTASLGPGDEGLNGWSWLGSVIPLVALVAGLILIGSLNGEYRARELAEVDAALLTDDLPPAAYTDAGFVQYVRFSAQADSLGTAAR